MKREYFFMLLSLGSALVCADLQGACSACSRNRSQIDNQPYYLPTRPPQQKQSQRQKDQDNKDKNDQDEQKQRQQERKKEQSSRNTQQQKETAYEPRTPRTLITQVPAADEDLDVEGYEVSAEDAEGDTETKTVIDVAANRADIANWLKALRASELFSTLQGAGPYTVFIPNDGAFAKLPPGTLQNLLKPENKKKLKDFISSHIAKGKLLSTNGKNQSFKTLGGKEVKLLADSNGGLRINNVKVVKADIQGKNGVVYIIDAVLAQ